MAKKSSADDLIPREDGGWNAQKERSSKISMKDIGRMEEQEDRMIETLGDMKLSGADKSDIAQFQKDLFGADGIDGMIKTGNKGISRKRLYEDLMTTFELNGIGKTNHVSDVVKQSIIAVLG